MTRGASFHRRQDRAARDNRRRALSMVEATVAAAIVGGVLVAALNAVGAAAAGAQSSQDRLRGALLCQQLMEEILAQPYAGSGPPAQKDRRDQFDEIDDYDGWSASPPQERNGDPVSGYEGWSRSVSVQLVRSDNLGQTITDMGVKRIVVTAARGGRQVARLEAYRTSAGHEVSADLLKDMGSKFLNLDWLDGTLPKIKK